MCKGSEGDRTSLGYPEWWLRDAGYSNYPSTHPPADDSTHHNNNGNKNNQNAAKKPAAAAAAKPAASTIGGFLRKAADHVDRLAQSVVRFRFDSRSFGQRVMDAGAKDWPSAAPLRCCDSATDPRADIA